MNFAFEVEVELVSGFVVGEVAKVAVAARN